MKIPRIPALAVATCLMPASALATMLYMPVNDGTTWTFETSGSWSDANGNTGSYGPSIGHLNFSRIDYPIFDQVATYVGQPSNTGEPGNTNVYLTETANGLFVVADNDPNAGQWYEYYTDPSPFFTTDDLLENQSVNYNGQWRGQWQDPGGGYQSWTGTWDTTITNLGLETVTTPLGTFQAVKFMDVTTSTQSPDSVHVAQSTMTGYSWMVDGVGIVKSTENWLNESDYNGDGIQDWWSQEESVRYLIATAEVPLPATAWLLSSGLLGLVGLRMRKQGRA